MTKEEAERAAQKVVDELGEDWKPVLVPEYDTPVWTYTYYVLNIAGTNICRVGPNCYHNKYVAYLPWLRAFSDTGKTPADAVQKLMKRISNTVTELTDIKKVLAKTVEAQNDISCEADN